MCAAESADGGSRRSRKLALTLPLHAQRVPACRGSSRKADAEKKAKEDKKKKMKEMAALLGGEVRPLPPLALGSVAPRQPQRCRSTA